MNRLILVLILLFSNSLMADIVVIQLRPNASTVESAKRAAAVRGEKVISLPSGKYKEITRENLSSFFKELEKSGVDVSSIVFSGHDGSGNFFGDYGDIYPEDVAAALSESPRISQGVQSF